MWKTFKFVRVSHNSCWWYSVEIQNSTTTLQHCTVHPGPNQFQYLWKKRLHEKIYFALWMRQIHENASFPGSRKLGTGFSILWVHSVLGRTSARRAQVPAHNCINEWLGEPVLVLQHPGRGILKNFINKVIIWNTLIVCTAKQKTTDDFTCRFIFLIGKTKNLQVKKFVKMN